MFIREPVAMLALSFLLLLAGAFAGCMDADDCVVMRRVTHLALRRLSLYRDANAVPARLPKHVISNSAFRAAKQFVLGPDADLSVCRIVSHACSPSTR